MKRLKLSILGVLMSGVMIIPAFAQEEPIGPKHEMRKPHEVFKQLNLSDEQKKQLEANKQQRKEQMKAMFQQMKAQREAMHQELMKKDLDMAKINGIQTQIKSLGNQMADFHLNSILEVRKILTPEQFAKFLSITEERRSKIREGRKSFKDKNEEHK